MRIKNDELGDDIFLARAKRENLDSSVACVSEV
jgi:hypothetical protein